MSSCSVFPCIPEEESVQRLPVLFGHDIDRVELNLSDSTNGQRIGIPGRGNLCDHIDVVDVSTSTRAKEDGPLEWMCPVCGMEYTHTDQVVIDGLIASILGELQHEDPEGTIRAINLNVDGTWDHVSDNPEDRVPMVRKKRARLTLAQASAIAGISGNTGPIDVESDSDSPVNSRPPPAAARRPLIVQRKHSSPSDGEVVDLDSD